MLSLNGLKESNPPEVDTLAKLFMRHRIDMVHHNPGEPLFDSAFLDPEHVKSRGYTGQAFKHINTVVTYGSVAPGVFPAMEEEAAWLETFTAAREIEIRKAKAAGLEVFYHIDLFVLPKRILDKFRNEIVNPATGRIELNMPKTQELHQVMLDEVFLRFPDIDGLIIRVGETYLYDTPFHTGNGAVHYHLDRSVQAMQEEFVTLIQFLRGEICEKHDKWLIYRTWDTWPNRFHSNRKFYLSVTNRIEPHPKLLFSIKHTRVDFHRWVGFNPCLAQGRHQQLVEVQCQREYEGKGAYPNYSSKGVIDCFYEDPEGRGLQDILMNPLVCGVYTWSRGGGWYGPYVNRHNELWCDLNAWVIAQYIQNPEKEETELFQDYAARILKLNEADVEVFRKIALISLDAVIKGKCCTVFDSNPSNVESCPTNQWMRDDVLHGLDKLNIVFDYLIHNNLTEEALEEKRESFDHWQTMMHLSSELSAECNVDVREVVQTSVEYGYTLFSAVAIAWEVMLKAYRRPDDPDLQKWIDAFKKAWKTHETFCKKHPLAATPYRGVGWHWPDKPSKPGLLQSMELIQEDIAYRQQIQS